MLLSLCHRRRVMKMEDKQVDPLQGMWNRYSGKGANYAILKQSWMPLTRLVWARGNKERQQKSQEWLVKICQADLCHKLTFSGLGDWPRVKSLLSYYLFSFFHFIVLLTLQHTVFFFQLKYLLGYWSRVRARYATVFVMVAMLQHSNFSVVAGSHRCKKNRFFQFYSSLYRCQLSIIFSVL